MNKKLNKSLRTVCIIVLWLVLIVAAYSAYNLYQYNRLHPNNKYEWNEWEGPPEEYIIKTKMMRDSKNIIILGVVLAIIWEVLLYVDDPEKHFITYWNNKLKEMNDE